MIPNDFYEWQRTYKFTAILFRDISSISKKTAPIDIATQTLFTVASPYISTLIKSVKVPQTDVRTKDVEYGFLRTLYPDLVVMPEFEIVFMEDQFNTVSRFMRMWFLELTNNGKMTFKPTGLVAMSLLFTKNTWEPLSSFNLPMGPTYGNGLGALSELPTEIQYYPRIIPTSVNEGTFDKTSEAFSEVTVKFARLPKIIMDKSVSLGASLG